MMIGIFRFGHRRKTRKRVCSTFTVRYSLNETKSLLKQAIKGLGAPQHLQESVTEAMVYAHEFGYASIDEQCQWLPKRGFYTSWQAFFNRPDKPLESGIDCLSFASNALLFESITQLDQKDLYEVSMATRGSAQHLAQLAYQLGQLGYYVNIQTEDQLLCAKPHQHPQLLQLETIADAGQLRMTVSENPIDEAIDVKSIQLSHQQARHFSDKHIDLGLEISPGVWQSLVDLASYVLVESNEKSRQGAGA